MAEPTKAELAGELSKRLQDLERVVAEFRTLSQYRLETLEANSDDQDQIARQLDAKVAELSAALGRYEERCRGLEKHIDRLWQVGLGLAAAGVALLVAILKK